MSGYTDTSVIQRRRDPERAFLAKPFTLSGKVRQVLGGQAVAGTVS
jgi:hypothetical protein